MKKFFALIFAVVCVAGVFLLPGCNAGENIKNWFSETSTKITNWITGDDDDDTSKNSSVKAYDMEKSSESSSTTSSNSSTTTDSSSSGSSTSTTTTNTDYYYKISYEVDTTDWGGVTPEISVSVAKSAYAGEEVEVSVVATNCVIKTVSLVTSSSSTVVTSPSATSCTFSFTMPAEKVTISVKPGISVGSGHGGGSFRGR